MSKNLFSEFVDKKRAALGEALGDGMNLGRTNYNVVNRTRTNMAEHLSAMLEEGEISPNTTVAQLLQILRS